MLIKMGFEDKISDIINRTETEFNDNKLIKLDLSSMNIKKLPAIIEKFSSLEILDLSTNDLKELPIEISSLSNLKELNLKYNDLITLPNTINKLSKLKKLDLERYGIYTYLMYFSLGIRDWLVEVTGYKKWTFLIDSEYKVLKEIEKLIDKPIEKLPTHMEEGLDISDAGIWITANRVIALIITNTNLVNLPPWIGNLKYLERLYIYNNKLQNLPDEITNLKKLTELMLNHNNLEVLPKQIKKLTRLRLLNLRGNPLPEDLAQAFGPKNYSFEIKFDINMSTFRRRAKKYFSEIDR